MPGLTKVDPAVLLQEYVTSEPPISYTALATKHGLHKTTLAMRARRENWTQKREAYWEALNRKVTEETANRRAAEKAAVYDLMFEAGHKYIERFASDLDEGKIKTTARDFATVANLLLDLLGTKSGKSETTILAYEGHAALDEGSLDNLESFLRRMAGEPAGRDEIVEGASLRLAAPADGAEGED